MTAPDYVDWNTPQAHADSIAATGVPLLNGANVITEQATPATIGALGTVTLGPFPCSQIGYDCSFIITYPGAATNPTLTAHVSWIDSGTGQVTGEMTWNMRGAAGGQTFHGTGRIKGDRVQIVLTNNDMVQTVTYELVFAQNSIIYQRDDWQQQTFNTDPVYQSGSYNPAGGILIFSKPAAIVAGGQWTRLVPLYSGKVTLRAASDGSQKGNVIVTSLDPHFTTPILGEAVIPASNDDVQILLALTRSQSLLTVNNTGGAASIYEVTIAIDQYAT